MLHLVLVLLIQALAAFMLYRLAMRWQRLAHLHVLNGRLLRLGAVAAVLTLAFSLLLRLAIPASEAQLHVQPQGPFVWLSIAGEALIKWGLLMLLLIRPRRYTDRYGVALYCLCLAIGYSLMATLLTEGGFSDPLWYINGLRTLAQQLFFLLLLAMCLIQALRQPERSQARRLWLLLALLLPMLVQGLWYLALSHSALNPWPVKLLTTVVVAALSLGLLYRLSLGNAPFAGVDSLAVLQREEEQVSLRQRLAYHFDMLLGRGNVALIGLMFLLGMALIAGVGLLLYWKVPKAVNGQLGHAMWTVGMRMLDGGNVSGDLNTGSALYVSMTLMMTLVGMVLFSSLVGLISNMMDIKLEKLRAGRVRVLERRHVVFLGQSEEAIAIMTHLAESRRRTQRLPMVLMDAQPREQLESAVAPMLHLRRGLTITCRQGDITDHHSLSLLGLQRARHIVISGEDSQALNCAAAVRQLLADSGGQSRPGISLLLSAPLDHLRAAQHLQGVQVSFANALSFAPILRAAGQRDFIPVYSQLTRMDRDSLLWSEVLSQTSGQDYYALASRFRYSCLIGLQQKGDIQLSPPADTRVAPGDALVFIRQPKDNLHLAAPGLVNPLPQGWPDAEATLPGVRQMLIIGGTQIGQLTDQLDALPMPPAYRLLPRYSSQMIEEALRAQPADLVLCLPQEDIPAQQADKHMMPYLHLLSALLAGSDAYLCANLTQAASLRYAYEQRLVDLVLQDDRSRLIATSILREGSQTRQVEESLFFLPSGLRLMPVGALAGSRWLIADLTASLAQRQMLLLGFLRDCQDGRQTLINPNKNEHITLASGDCLILV